MIAAPVFFGHFIEHKAVFQLGHGDMAVQQPTAVFALHGPGCFWIARMEFASECLDQVLQGHDALELPILVDHECHVHVRQSEALEEFHPSQGFGHVQRRLQRLALQIALTAAQGLGQPLARIDDSNQPVQSAAHHRKVRVVRRLHTRQVFVKGDIEVERCHISSRHHQRADLAIVEPEHIAHHHMLMRFNHARRRAFGQHGVNLFLGHRAATGFLHAQQAQQRAGGHRQQHDERFGCHREPVDRL
ncbi:hypothetical protein D9M72_283130 [compost metagenome]